MGQQPTLVRGLAGRQQAYAGQRLSVLRLQQAYTAHILTGLCCRCCCGCRRLDNMELSFFNNSRSVEMVQSFLQKGALHDMSFLQVRAG